MTTPDLTFSAARLILNARHQAACMRIHDLVVHDAGLMNNEWPELRQARKDEFKAAEDLLRLNWVQSDFREPHKPVVGFPPP